MIPLPKWIREIFDKGTCPNPECKKPLKKRGVFGIGIREEKIDKKKIQSFCYEYECPSCKQRTVFTGFPTSFEDFIADLIDLADIFPEEKPTGGKGDEVDSTYLPEETPGSDYDDGALESEAQQEEIFEDIEENPLPPIPRKSKMTEKEISEGIKMINAADYHEDLLDMLGIKRLEKEPEDENK